MRGFRRSGIPELSGVTAELIVELCGVHITTARRWKRGEYPPLSALKVIALYQTGELGAVDPKWNGWSLRNGLLTTPDEAYTFSPGEVQAIPFQKQLIRHYQDEQRLPRQGDWISEKWVPTAELEVEKRA